ncbi:MamI family restriction endonuclease [Candidatus Poriferisodalis sp.]|uniref:MamI family restriction endonuclease n=1 Tax=Candidatus Poriferisodalis sp. TaxID=3101277 RepID=UPI003B010D3D
MEQEPSVAELNEKVRRGLAKSFIEDAVIGQYHQLVRWQHITGQSAQIDSGYLGQHLVSLVSGIPGRGRGSRGKGADLADGSEIKIASTLGGVDKPRWNNKLNTPQAVDTYLNNPAIFFSLFDTPERGKDLPVRVRVWVIEPPQDAVFCNVVRTWAAKHSSGNFQLHPPCWSDSDVATNQSGDIALPLAFRATQLDIRGVDYLEVEHWDPSPGKCSVP